MLRLYMLQTPSLHPIYPAGFRFCGSVPCGNVYGRIKRKFALFPIHCGQNDGYLVLAVFSEVVCPGYSAVFLRQLMRVNPVGPRNSEWQYETA